MTERGVCGPVPAEKITEDLRVLQVEQSRERIAIGAGGAVVFVLQVSGEQFVELAHASPAAPAKPGARARRVVVRAGGRAAQCCRSAISLLISAMALAGLRSFGQACAQFMMVWQR